MFLSPNMAAMMSAANPERGEVLPYMAYIGMCGPKGYGFSAVLVINRVSILAILPPFKSQVINRVSSFWSSYKWGREIADFVYNWVGKIADFGHK